MTTKKKSGAKSKSVAEPAVATKTVKASKKAMPAPAKVEAPKAEAVTIETVKAEAPVAPTVAAAMAATVPAAPKAPEAPKAEAPVAKEKAVLTVGMFQKRLYEKGFYGGHWDGNYGPMTKAAVRNFQASQGLPVDGEPTPETLAALGF
jgi:peptidoglycan hydrolase-like protein with peptidoglycan-binding domain